MHSRRYGLHRQRMAYFQRSPNANKVHAKLECTNTVDGMVKRESYYRREIKMRTKAFHAR